MTWTGGGDATIPRMLGKQKLDELQSQSRIGRVQSDSFAEAFGGGSEIAGRLLRHTQQGPRRSIPRVSRRHLQVQ